jgi:PAS domain S-box-containing protein
MKALFEAALGALSASRRTLSTAVAVVAVGAIGVVLGVAGVRSLERREIRHAGEALAVASASIADELAVVLHSRVNDVALLAMGILGTEDPVPDTWSYLAALKEGSPFYLWLAVADRNGRLVSATDPSSVGKEYGNADWFAAARASDGARLLDVQRWDEVFSMPALPVVSAMDSPRFEGVLVGLIGMSPIEAMVARRMNDLEAQLSPDTHVDWQIVSDQGVVLADSAQATATAETTAPQPLWSAGRESGETGYVVEGGSAAGPARVLGFARVSGATNAEDLGWRVLLSRPRDEVLAPVHRSMGLMAALVAALLFPTAAAVVWSRRGRRRAENAKHLAHARLQAIVDNAQDAIVVTDHEGRIRDVNPAAENMFGWPRDEMIGREMGDVLIPDGQREAHRLELERCRETGDTRVLGKRLEFAAQRRDGTTFAVEFTVVGLPTNPPLFSAVIRDIEGRRRLEIELRHAQKLESIGQLAAGVAHEINTPIQFVGDNVRFLEGGVAGLLSLIGQYERACADLAEGRDADVVRKRVSRAAEEVDLVYLREEMPKAISQTEEGVQRVSKIVRAMRTFAHQSTTREKQPADLNEALRSTLTVATSLLKYVADVELDLRELPPVPCHLSDLNQVFLNLFANAAHAIEDVVRDSGNRGRITVRSRCEGESVVISVADTGCGIPEEARSRIFDPFFTTKEVGRGTGQGLSLARSIVVDGHGGQLTFETDVGRGTTFEVRLPLGVEPARSAA